MLNILDETLNKITMYRLVVYGLSLLSLVTFVFSITGSLDFSPAHMAASLIVIMTTGFATNQLLQRVLSIPANAESGLITCLILFFLVSPTGSVKDLFTAALVTIIAIASKFFIAFHGKHIFNPAAFGLVAVGLIGYGHASWWVGSIVLWPFTLVVGLLIMRKIRCSQIVLFFWAIAILVSSIIAMHNAIPLSENIKVLLLSSPLIFLSTIMLTEPSTMPPKRNKRLIFAAIVGVLFAWHPGSGILFIYPETALVLGNLYAYLVSPKRRYKLTYVSRTKQGSDSYDYEFKSNERIKFKAGQYIECTLPLNFAEADDRGNRRTFTIASAPTESRLHIGLRIPKKASKFKQALAAMEPGQALIAGQVAGDFVLPSDTSVKLLGIAGGVGITPFRSMVKELNAMNQKRDMVILYVALNEDDLMYKDIFEEAKKVGLTMIYATSPIRLTGQQIKDYVPDVISRTVYISGPPAMTRHTARVVKSLGIRRSHIKTDYFAGY